MVLKIFKLSVFFLFILLAFSFIMPNPAASDAASQGTRAQEAEGIQWMSWQEAVEASRKNQKKIFVDCYTDWCGWCKRMDQTTFTDPQVVAFMNKHFYAVKLNAEQKEDIVWRNNTFKFIEGGRRGVHQLAYSLLDGKLGYPSFVYLNENFDRITISPGYKNPDGLIKELQWVGEDHYKSVSFQEFSTKQ